MKLYLLFILSLLISLGTFSQSDWVWLHPNKGQWNSNVNYQIDLASGKMYIENDGFTYHLYETPYKDHDHSHTSSHQHDDHYEGEMKQHVVKSTFIGSSWGNEKIENERSNFYRNYFIGQDQTNWASQVYSYGEVILKNYYPSIDLKVNGASGQLKYSFIVAPNTSANPIKWETEGANSIKIDAEGNLILETIFGTIKETKPVSWTIRNGVKTMIETEYKITNNQISFYFPNGYNEDDTLIIDPYLVFSTYTGATSDNWGMTATPGPNGEMYSGGIIFGSGYPVSTGAYDGTYNGGTPNNNITGFDVSIAKFSADGSQLLSSTFLGGSANELPESIITAANGDLYILGITASPNFPLGSSPYQATFGGGPTSTQNSLRFVGSDIFVAKLNSAGTQLLASTFIGGNDLDGLNTSLLAYNYGDQFRGEIILEGDHIFVASHTRSSNFPVTNGTSLSGTQDIITFKMSDDLSSLIWSSYYGGTGDETGNSVALVGSELFITGGTTSSNFSLTGNDPSFGGDRDGYIIKLDANNGTLVNGTYIGENEYDQCYFVRSDIDNFIYIFGQTSSAYTITSGKYGNANSGQFIRKYTNDLLTIDWTTMIGAGSGVPEISPTAFLISDCYDIFLSGWGGVVNQSHAPGSTTNGFPVTSGAYQSTTSGSNFYLGILSQDANNLTYGTFMGGFSSSYNHVDGGTSRFDRSGAVYHAVCAACGGNDYGFVSTPGAWSTTNNSPNCNLAAFKFQLGMPYSLSADSTVCNGGSVQLNATGGINYTWSPATSLNNPNIPNPIATPTETTVYYVSMDFNEGCAIVDSIVVEVISAPVVDLTATVNVCLNDTIAITASGGLTYSWSPNTNISSLTNQTVNVWPTQSMYYYVNVGNECFETLDSIWVNVLPLPEIILTDDTIICVGTSALLNPQGNMTPIWEPDPTLLIHANGTATATPLNEQHYYVNGIDQNGCRNRDSVLVSFYDIPDIVVSPDTSICYGTSTILNASGGINYSWTPSSTLTGANTASPTATPIENTIYTVTATYEDGCLTTEDVSITLLYLPVPILPDTIHACYGTPKEATVGGADSYVWSPGTYLNTTTGPTVEIDVEYDIVYTVTFTNICGSVEDSVYVNAIYPHVEAYHDTILCPGEATQLYATGSQNYTWTPSAGLDDPYAASVIARPQSPTLYIVSGIDQYGCTMSDSVFVDLFPQPIITASDDQYLLEGDPAYISGTTSSIGMIYWTPSEHLSCVTCPQTVATPDQNYRYTVTIIDENGCTDSDDVFLFFEALLFVPNTFTPDGDEFNNAFKARGGNMREFEMLIFNRWGEKVFESHDMNIGWDGTYNGTMSQDGTYTWKITYKDLYNKSYERVGHVNLIR